MDIGGTSYNPADLMVEEGKVVTLPEEASFGDAELSLEALPEEAPANAVALLQYVYNERKVGQAYLLDKTIQVPAETEPSGGDAAEPGTEDGSGGDRKRRPGTGGYRGAHRDGLCGSGENRRKVFHEASEGCDPWCDPGGPGSLGAGLWMVWIRKRRKEEAEAAPGDGNAAGKD